MAGRHNAGDHRRIAAAAISVSESLFQRACSSAGIHCPAGRSGAAGLARRSSGMAGWAGDCSVYNRLTDFTLTQPASRALLQRIAPTLRCSPHPACARAVCRQSAIWRVERPAVAGRTGIAIELRQRLLAGVPATRLVTRQRQRALGAAPAAVLQTGQRLAASAAYRGDKLTRRVWDEIVAGEYVAQRIRIAERARGGAGAEQSPANQTRCPRLRLSWPDSAVRRTAVR